MPDAKDAIKLYLLGGLELAGAVDGALAHRLLAQPKLTALLAFLALSPDARPQRRDRIVGMLWPELDQSHARTALRKAVHSIRTSVGGEALWNRGDEEIGLAMPPVWCDAVESRAAADAGRMLRVHELYKGDLLQGFHLAGCVEFQHWLDVERSEARERAAAAAWGLACIFERDQRFTDAGVMAKRAVRYSADDERVLRRTMVMLQRIGDHAGALKLFDEFATRMRAELDADPSPETLKLVSSLRSSAVSLENGG
jgi:DNA-binding SARP family transcriptional activator